jgi:hypothetical protein
MQSFMLSADILDTCSCQGCAWPTWITWGEAWLNTVSQNAVRSTFFVMVFIWNADGFEHQLFFGTDSLHSIL